MKLKTVSGLDWVRRHPERFFTSGEPTAREIIWPILDDIFAVAAECSVRKVGSWWVITSATDWLRHPTRTVEELFHHIVPAPELGDNSMRAEIIVYIFAQDVVTSTDGNWHIIKGVSDTTLISDSVTAEATRALAFRLADTRPSNETIAASDIE